ncbi:HypC/HybG/HupF family hydrogenase formation chaperone [Roseibium alexandrii]|jgi:hydrogenase expression/formation protein HypC|uniref:Hydrogenase maturation factor HypC n=1 Tax=Roseibium alexandrii TaxID=388408 RepID=A0A0M7AM38_9HYPH|nr:HypC/HybG/HupF family hydrogenase formation chaperone [Roseibium alexandrii]CTQ76195.1 Hydrogenase isoenzymes formation protein HypC [Roseibium alexandrii]
MCLAIPAKITELDGDDMAVVALEGIKKRISTALVEDLAVGDYVLVHVGYALHKVSPDEAARTLQLMAEAGVLQEELDEMTGAGQ